MGQACCTHKSTEHATQLENRVEQNLQQVDDSSNKQKERIQPTDDSTPKDNALPNGISNKNLQNQSSIIKHTFGNENEEENDLKQEKNNSRIGLNTNHNINGNNGSLIEINSLFKNKSEIRSDKESQKTGVNHYRMNGETSTTLNGHEKSPLKICTEQEIEQQNDTCSKKTTKTAAAVIDHNKKDIDFFMDLPGPPNLRDIHKEGSLHNRM